MKTAVLPSVQVEPELLDALGAVLNEGQTIADFVGAAVRVGVERRRIRAAFIARGLRSWDEARRTGKHADAEVVLDELQRKLADACARLPRTSG